MMAIQKLLDTALFEDLFINELGWDRVVGLDSIEMTGGGG